MRHDLESLLEQIDFSSFLSLANYHLDDAFTIVKRNAKFYNTRYVKVVPLISKGIKKGYLFG